MAEIFGSLGMADSDLPFTSVEGQNVIWTETDRVFQMYNTDLESATSLFIGETTEAFKERYYLPGGGESQDEDITMAGETAAVKPVGEWDVAYPLFQIGDSIAFNDVSIRYVSLARYEATIKSVFIRNNNTLFKRLLRALLKNTNTAFTDPIHGTLTIMPLANGDGVLYPPAYGTEGEAEQNFYIGTSYLPAAIDNTNNPYLTVRDKLEPMYGFPQGGSPILALVATNVVAPSTLLAGWNEVTNRYSNPGDNITTLTGLPSLPNGMRIVGVESVSGVVVVEWPRLPSGMIIGLHAEAPKPLKRRKDKAETGLAPGLTLWSETLASQPFRTARWRNRMGFGVGNRLGAVVMNLNGSGTYSIPTGYA